MVTVITKFEAKDDASTTELLGIFQKLLQETPMEKGYISYEILSVKETLNTFYIIEKWNSEKDLQNHASLIEDKGYASQTVSLLKNKIENTILQTLN
ncbi:antibiotic biosynthesis monooxygenase family protein [Flavobacterium sp. MC2016-06]|jgi:quinol monooxygenase YgiN|uniref:putative quinol monooxygenase n=1 Tax=Flavobacterium sp. MC2016-06 TaxID=2676308 RepID=UPI0012BA87F5|nr:antibiotic biosynthesis monooxygenase family protein [Flavobacterium sp. MC2016-06]MBU3860672.1 antibiotic biosynthesis monooxygenase [Flavobacterium sp. MC2016-06]